MSESTDEEAAAAPRIQRIPGRSRRVRYAAEPLEPPTDPVPGDTRTPERSADSTDQAWQDGDDSNDDRLKRDKPPHWA